MPRTDAYYATMPVEDELPARFERHRDLSLPEGIRGSHLVNFGAAPDELGLEGGGLVIDYRPAGSAVVRRAVIAFNEAGMWIEGMVTLPATATTAAGRG